MALTPPRAILITAVVIASLVAIGRAEGELCASPPISLGHLNSAIAQPAVPFAENVIADGQLAVDQETHRTIGDVLDQVVACSNAGEPLRVWSLYSDAYISRLFQIQGPFTDIQYEAYARPQPGGEEMRLERVERVWLRPDGKVGADVVMRYPSVPMPKRLLFWFAVAEDQTEIEEVTGEISFSLP